MHEKIPEFVKELLKKDVQYTSDFLKISTDETKDGKKCRVLAHNKIEKLQFLTMMREILNEQIYLMKVIKDKMLVGIKAEDNDLAEELTKIFSQRNDDQ